MNNKNMSALEAAALIAEQNETLKEEDLFLKTLTLEERLEIYEEALLFIGNTAGDRYTREYALAKLRECNN